jgi:hypothetical protein
LDLLRLELLQDLGHRLRVLHAVATLPMATILIDDEESVRALLRFPLEAAGDEKPSAIEKAVTSLYPSLKWLTLDDNPHI